MTDVYSSFPAELKEYVEPYEGNDEKFAKRILENPQISTWEKILDKLKR